MSRESCQRTGERSETCGEGLHFGMIDAGKFLRRGVSDDSSIFEKNDARGEEERFAKIVGDKDDGLAETAREGAEFALKLGAGDGIESTKGLVHQENGRVGGEGASDADALTLAPESRAVGDGSIVQVQRPTSKRSSLTRALCAWHPIFQEGDERDVLATVKWGKRPAS